MHIRLGNYTLFFSVFHSRKTYGICSRTRNDQELHYLLFDVDDPLCVPMARRYFHDRYYMEGYRCYSYGTVSGGLHTIVLKAQDIYETAIEMLQCPFVDSAHVGIGLKRGYWFLNTYQRISDSHLTYMRIERNAKDHKRMA